jgi:hypothetical protein
MTMYRRKPVALYRKVFVRRPRWPWLSIVVAVAFAAIAAGGIWLYRHTERVVTDCYMQEHVAAMIIEHMERNRDAWPKSWEDLAEANEICEARSGPNWTLDELRERCSVDFNAEPGNLVKATATEGEPPFHVVRLVSGESHYWSGAEPNQMILDYLKNAAKRPADYVYPTKPVEEERTARRALLERGASWRLENTGHVVWVQMGSVEGSPRFSDDDLMHVAALYDLQELNLQSSNITDAGLPKLAGLKKLRTLYLSNTHVTDKGLRSVASLSGLEELTLAYCNIADNGIISLQQLPSLKLLNLNYTNVGDVGVDALCSMKSLTDLLIGDTKITTEGARRLKAALPDAQIYHSHRIAH